MFNVIFTLAWKNAFLKRARSLLLVLMIAISMSVMITLEAIYDGMLEHMIQNTKRVQSGDATLFAQGYYSTRSSTAFIADISQKRARISKQLPDAVSIERIIANGLAQTARKARDAAIIGVEFSDEERFGKLSQYITAEQPAKKRVIIGSELAKNLHVTVGDRIIFSTQSITQEISAIALRISAIITTNTLLIDQQGIIVERALVQKLLHLPNDSATMIAVRSDNASLLSTLHTLFPSLDCRSFSALNPQLKQMQQMMGYFNILTFAIVMSIVFIGIFGVIYISILERIREFGIMLALGYAKRFIAYELILEATIIALAGFMVGSLLALLFLSYLHTTGLNLAHYASGLAQFGMNSTLYASIHSSYFTHALIAITVAALFSALFAFRRLSRRSITQSIKEPQ